MFNIIIGLISTIGWAYLFGTTEAKANKPIGYRTLALLMLGGFAIGYITLSITDYHMIGQAITGVSFLCGGVIYKADDRVHGLTTGALIWSLVVLSLLWGFGMWIIANSIAIIMYTILKTPKLTD